MKKIVCILLILILMIAATGCGKQSEKSTAAQAAPPKTVPAPAISPEVDAAAKELLTQYFQLLFTAPSVDVYTESSRTGICLIPSGLSFPSGLFRKGTETPKSAYTCQGTSA